MSIIERVLLWLMGAFYILAGVFHFTSPDFYVAIMPDWLPWHLELVWLSGVAEIVCGIGLLVPRTRILAAWATIALLVAVFPANLDMALNDVLVQADPATGRLVGVHGAVDDARNWIRLPFQGLFIFWAWWYTRPLDRSRD